MNHVSQSAVRLGLRTVAVALSVLVALAGSGGSVSAAGPADLVQDINTVAAGSGATPLTAAGGSLLVSACRGDGQRPIFAIDGPDARRSRSRPSVPAMDRLSGGPSAWATSPSSR